MSGKGVPMLSRSAVILLCLTFSAVTRADPAPDPLQSPVWADMVKAEFAGADYVFDERVKVSVPATVENQAQVPVTADARDVPNVEKLVVFADLNPIQHVLTFSPRAAKAEPYVSFRMKVEQATPVRAAALTSDGIWHVGGVFLEAAGGGCSAPASARGDADWTETVGNAQGRVWREADGAARLRLRIRHPMDTGLAKDHTPAFYIENFEMKAGGNPLARIEMFEPVSEDPMLTIILRPMQTDGAVTIDGRDNNGTIYRSVVPLPWNQSALDVR
jgi:sulfur-oxidizing protein SoxY